MKLDQLRMFVAVADVGSFSAAAVELDCTQSRISHAIAQLESELNVRLLLRSHEGSVPTEAGRRVLDKARQMLRLEGELQASANPAGVLEGRVRIACFRSIGTHLLSYAAQALGRAHPGIVLDIDDGNSDRLQVTQAVRERRADLAIAQMPVGRDLVLESYLQDDYVLVTPAALRLSEPIAWRQLDDLAFIRLGCTGADEVLARCRDAGFGARAEHSLLNDTSIAAMVGRGMGYSILPRLAIFPQPAEVNIAALPIQARRQFALAGFADTLRAPHIREVLRLLRDPRMVARTPAFQAGVLRWP
jgi:DNA-binding transcriptional LysR family regulator